MTLLFVTFIVIVVTLHAVFSAYLVIRPEHVMALTFRMTMPHAGPYVGMMKGVANLPPYRWLFEERNWEEVSTWGPSEFRSSRRLMATTRALGWLSLGLNAFITGLSATMAIV